MIKFASIRFRQKIPVRAFSNEFCTVLITIQKLTASEGTRKSSNGYWENIILFLPNFDEVSFANDNTPFTFRKAENNIITKAVDTGLFCDSNTIVRR